MAQASAADLPVPAEEDDEDDEQLQGAHGAGTSQELAEFEQFRQWMRSRGGDRRSEHRSLRPREQSRHRA